MNPLQPLPGWYSDPYRPNVERYWTGHDWDDQARRPVATPPGPVPVAVLPLNVANPRRRTLLVASRAGRARLWPVLSVASGGVMAVGSFLPWATLSSVFGDRATLRGTSSGDGWLTLACGVAIAATGVASLPRPRRLATVAADLVAVAGVILAGYELVHLSSLHGVLGSANAEGTWAISYGAGLSLVALAAVVALISAAGITGRDARSLLGD